MIYPNNKKNNIVWVTNISTSVGAVVGGLWFYLLRGYPCPSRVYLLRTVGQLGRETDFALKVVDWLNETFCNGGFNVFLWDTKDDFQSYDRDLGDFLLGVKDADVLVLDFTPGRKYMAISMVKYLLDIQRGVSGKSGVFGDAKFRDVRLLNLFLTRYKELYGRDYILTDLPIWAFDLFFRRMLLVAQGSSLGRTNGTKVMRLMSIIG